MGCSLNVRVAWEVCIQFHLPQLFEAGSSHVAYWRRYILRERKVCVDACLTHRSAQQVLSCGALCSCWLNKVVWYQLQSKFNLAIFVFSTCTYEHSQHSLQQHFISGRHLLMSSYETLLTSPGASYVPSPRAACC